MPYKNREDKRAHDRAWKAAKRSDPEYMKRLRVISRMAGKRYRMKHPERAAEWAKVGETRWQRAAQSADGTVTSDVLNYLLETPVCPYCCVAMTPETATIDHIVPISKGGQHTAENLAAVCKKCNRAKHASSLVGYLLRLRVLPATST